MGAGMALAASPSWNAGSGTWDDTTTANWSTAKVPASGDSVYITNASVGSVTVDYAATGFSGTNALNNLWVGKSGGQTNFLQLGSGDTLQVTGSYNNANSGVIITNGGWMAVGSGAALIQQTVQPTDHLIVNGGTLELAGGAITNGGNFSIRGGSYTQASGTHLVYNSIFLADAVGQNAKLTMSGGVLTNISFDLLAKAGNSTLSLSGGEINIARTWAVGTTGGTHNWTINNGTLNVRVNGEPGDGIGSKNGSGSVTLTQTGGLVKINALHMFGTVTYNLQGGAMTNGSIFVDGTFTQTLGTNYNSNDAIVGTAAGRTGTYSLVSGVFRSRGFTIARVPDSVGTFTMSGGTVTMGNSLSGADAFFTIGASSGAGSGTLVLKGGSIGGSAYTDTGMVVNATGTVRGYGTISVNSVRIGMGGRVIADGEGADRTLNLSSFNGVSNYVDNVSDKGWFATGHGKLVLPNVTVNAATTNIYNWGEQQGDTTIDLVNSARLQFTGLSGSGSLTGAVYSVDRPEANPSGDRKISVHEFGLSGGPTFTKCSLTIRYDDSVAPGLDSRIVMARWTGTSWAKVATTVDAANHRITADNLTALGRFSLAVFTSGTVICVQ